MNKWQQYKEKLGTTRPWDVLNPSTEFSEEELFNKRMDSCYSCNEFIKVTAQCKQCGCFMKLKARLKEAKCPINRW
jgi:hypothetical protein